MLPLDLDIKEKLTDHYGFQMFTNSNILAAILSVEISHVTITKQPSIPPPKVKQEQNTQVPKVVEPMHDDDATDDELDHNEPMVDEEEEPLNNDKEDDLEPPTKKTKPTTPEEPLPPISEPPKKSTGISIPQSLEASSPTSQPTEDHFEEKRKKPSPKKEAVKKEVIKKEPVKRETQNESDDDAPTITVEYIDLVKVKDEKQNSQPSNYKGFNAKKFRKVSYGKTVSPSAVVSPLKETKTQGVFDSVNLGEVVDSLPPSVEKKRESLVSVEADDTITKNASSILDAIGIDDDSSSSDDEMTLLNVKSKSKKKVK